MIERQEIAEEALRQIYPPHSSEPHWGEVLRRLAPAELSVDAPGVAERARTVRPARNRLRIGALGVVAAAGLAFIVFWIIPGAPSLSDRALAAIGQARYIHVVASSPAGGAYELDVRTGKVVRLRRQFYAAYDETTMELREVVAVGGHPLVQSASSVDPGIASFASGYRRALRVGEAHVVRRAHSGGRVLIIVRFRTGENSAEEVALDASSYRPVWIRKRSGSSLGTKWFLSTIKTAASRPVLPRVPTVDYPSGRFQITASNATVGSAVRALGRKVLVVGGAARLRRTRIQIHRLTGIPIRAGLAPRLSAGAEIDYVGRTGWVQIQESTVAQPAYGFYSPHLGAAGWISSPSHATISCETCGPGAPKGQVRWLAQLREAGLYVTITASSRGLVTLVARSLRLV